MRVILASYIHHCHVTWYGVSSEERMERLVTHLNDEYERDPYEVILFLGDYSLDFWEWDIKGCYINEGKSYTRAFVKTYAPRLRAPYMMIAGNHEQYGEAAWRGITGFGRQGFWQKDGWLFLLTDSFAANLDPSEHSDGTFTPIDVSFCREKMAEFPDARIVLCGHHFDPARETEEGRALICDPRVVCLAAGHVHLSDVITLPEDCGGKKLLRTGQYSYSAHRAPLSSMWGFRELILMEDQLTSRYITPANRIILDGKTIDVAYGTQDEVVIACEA